MSINHIAALPRRRAASAAKAMAVAAAIVAGLMLAPGAFADEDCGPVPDAQAPLPSGTLLVWVSDISGSCILGTDEYTCDPSSGSC